jgi:predicted nucleic acid-binding protein
MFYLLDVNVLIASADPGHEFHAAFHRWFRQAEAPALATCPLSENGYLRIYGHASYPGGPGSPMAAMPPCWRSAKDKDTVSFPMMFPWRTLC